MILDEFFKPNSTANLAEDNPQGTRPDDEVKFFIDSEPAYYAVMDRFGDHIDFRGDDMVAPLRLWSAIQQTAGDAGGAADIAGLEDDRMGTDDELDEQGMAEGSLNEFAPSNGGGDSGNYFQALASAWYNGTFDSGSLQKGIKSQEDVERLLQRGVVCPDGVTRKFDIGYNSDFDGVVISSDDYYEHADHDETDSRTGKPFGPYDYMEFGGDDLDESAQWRDPRYKDQLYTQEKPDYNDTREYDRAMWDPKPKGYKGRKEPMAGGEFPRTDPLVKGFGRYGVGEPVSKGPRKGLPSRDQITSLKGSIKDAHGKHHKPNLPEQGMAEGSAADGSVNYTLGHTPDAEYVYHIYRDGKKEGTYHSVDQAREIMGNMMLTRPNREYKIKRGTRNKMAGPTGQLPEADVSKDHDQQLSVQQLATISDEALDNAYGYGRSSPGNTFGWQANLKSAAYAKQMIDRGATDIEAISDAIHQGWNTTAKAFVQNPEQFDDTEKLRAAGKLEAKLQQRAKLMNIDYDQLPDDEQEKDRVVARALLQALKGCQDMAEAGYDSGDYSNDRQSDDYGRDLVPTGPGGSRFVNHGAHDHTRGRPAKTHGFSKNLPADPFGRTAGKIPHSARPKQELDPFRELDELSPATLARYKTKAGAAATAADSAGDRKTGDRRFSGIVKATKKQFDQDAKQSAQAVHESRLRLMASIIKTQ